MTEMLLQHGSYLAIILVLVLTGSGLPIPEEVPIVTAGILSAHGQLDPWMALASCLFGALVGDCVMYAIGRRFGRSVVREHRWWARFVKPQREERIEGMIERHGLKVFFVARFLVGLRSPAYLAAGVLRVPFRRFLLIDLFCATTVIGLFFTLSFSYGTTITKWIRDAEVLWTAVVVLALAGVAIFYWRRRRCRQPAGSPEATEAAVPEPELSEVPPVASTSSDAAGWHANCSRYSLEIERPGRGRTKMKAELIRTDANPLRPEESLDGLPILIGRSLDCGIQLESPWASRCHCEIDQIEGTLVVRDLGSENGTFVNGYRVTEAHLKPGDRLTVGGASFLVQYQRSECKSHEHGKDSPTSGSLEQSERPKTPTCCIPGTSVPAHFHREGESVHALARL